jgi:hypothetical protein
MLGTLEGKIHQGGNLSRGKMEIIARKGKKGAGYNFPFLMNIGRIGQWLAITMR